MLMHDTALWAMAKYLAEVDFRVRCQSGEDPPAAWAGTSQRLSEMLDATGYNLSFFAPEVTAMKRALLRPARAAERAL
ncbi:hypothetical protein [Deinococcus radiotolerans]|nr:hypothetical protein [Deinococcus radiotolerans]